MLLFFYIGINNLLLRSKWSQHCYILSGNNEGFANFFHASLCFWLLWPVKFLLILGSLLNGRRVSSQLVFYWTEVCTQWTLWLSSVLGLQRKCMRDLCLVLISKCWCMPCWLRFTQLHFSLVLLCDFLVQTNSLKKQILARIAIVGPLQ